MEFIKRKLFLLLILVFFGFSSNAQYAPAAGKVGSTAIHKDSISIVAWANQCTISRGWQTIADQSLGKTTVGSQSSAIGIADNDVISLGDGGIAVVQFAQAISNGTGPDFAVFENAFDDLFLELAFVEVSSDGQNFVRFPSHSLTQTTTQIGGFGQIQTEKIHNLAGKYRASYGTPFDLEELKDSVGLDIMHITHIKIIDVVGSLDSLYANFDSQGRIINEPFPTPFSSGGFDLDAVGILHLATSIQSSKNESEFKIYPNPAQDFISVITQEAGRIEVYSAQGLLLKEAVINKGANRLDISSLPQGVYFIVVISNDSRIVRRLIKN